MHSALYFFGSISSRQLIFFFFSWITFDLFIPYQGSTKNTTSSINDIQIRRPPSEDFGSAPNKSRWLIFRAQQCSLSTAHNRDIYSTACHPGRWSVVHIIAIDGHQLWRRRTWDNVFFFFKGKVMFVGCMLRCWICINTVWCFLIKLCIRDRGLIKKWDNRLGAAKVALFCTFWFSSCVY